MNAMTWRLRSTAGRSISLVGAPAEEAVPLGIATAAMASAATAQMPALTKALRQPTSSATRPANKKERDAPIVNELVYQATVRARPPPSARVLPGPCPFAGFAPSPAGKMLR